MIRATPMYQERPERRGISRRRVIDEAKAKVATIDLADLLCGPGRLRRQSGEWVGLCPLPDHEERTPSFTVNPEKDVFWCFGCLRGGDVVELARFAWGYDKSEAPMAAAQVLHEFGHEMPPRPASWFGKQERQRSVRDELERAKLGRVQRRLYRWLCTPDIARFEDEAERREEEGIAWEDCERVARIMVYRARGERA